jgi:hypothetical protein
MMQHLIRQTVTGLLFSAATLHTATAQLNEPMPGRILTAGISLHATDLWGDIGTSEMAHHYNNSHYRSNLKGAAGLWARYDVWPFLGVRLGLAGGTLYASDRFNQQLADRRSSDLDKAYLLYLRNLDVKTHLYEASLMLELQPLRIAARSEAARFPLQPWLGAGLAVFHFDPRGSHYDPEAGTTRWVKLRPLHLEGEGLPGGPEGFSRTQLAIPLSGGLRYEAGRRLSLSLDLVYRYTCTDYLDGVSRSYVDPAVFDQHLSPEQAALAYQMYDKTLLLDATRKHPVGDVRGNPAVKDGYMSWGLSIGWKLGN